MHMFLYLLWISRKLLVFISAIAHVYLKLQCVCTPIAFVLGYVIMRNFSLP